MDQELELTHHHPDGSDRPRMRAGYESRIDGLVVREFECPCGYSVAVLAREAERQIGASWPFQFSRPA